MVSNQLDREIESREFEYGEHTILITISMKHQYLSNASVTYGTSGRHYYRRVSVSAYQTDEYKEENTDDISSDAFNSTYCSVRAEPYEPNITVPEDPSLSPLQRLKVWIDEDATREDMKDSVRSKHRQKIQKRRVPSGSAVDLATQIEESVRPVLETVDSQYRVMSEDIDIDIDVSVERMSAEVSWVEVDDEMERISQEMENLTEM